MAITWTDTPLIKKIKLPSGNEYFLADREAREEIETLAQTVAGGVSFEICWNGTSVPDPSKIPAGVVVIDQGITYTGTLSANSAQPGVFYLVHSSTQPSGMDVYDEYVPVGSSGNKTWEKIGDTQVDISNVVVNINTTTVSALGPNTSATSPTVTVSSGNITKTTASNILTRSTTLTLSSGSVTGTGGAQEYFFGPHTPLELADGGVTITTSSTYIGAALAANAVVTGKGTEIDAVTDFSNITKEGVVKSVSVTSDKKLETTSVIPASSTTGNFVQSRSKQTTATGGGTATSANTDWLKGCSVSNEILSIGAATLNTQDTYQAAAPATVTYAVAGTAKTVATGATTTNGSGASVVTGVSVGSTVSAITSIGKTTAKAIQTLTTGAPTITVSTSTSSANRAKVLTGVTSAYVKDATISYNPDSVSLSAYYSLPTYSVGTGITVGSNNTVTALTGITSISVPSHAVTLNKSYVNVVDSVTPIKGSSLYQVSIGGEVITGYTTTPSNLGQVEAGTTVTITHPNGNSISFETTPSIGSGVIGSGFTFTMPASNVMITTYAY